MPQIHFGAWSSAQPPYELISTYHVHRSIVKDGRNRATIVVPNCGRGPSS
jgi:hypothetical protein